MSATNSLRLSPATRLTSAFNEFSLSSGPSEQPIADLTYDLEPTTGFDSYLGIGGYAEVYKYRSRASSLKFSTGRVFAVKFPKLYHFNRDDKKATQRTGREMKIWASLDHDNILKFHGFLSREGNPLPCLVSDYMENGTAGKYLKENPDSNLIQIIQDIARGLLYLHRRDVAHSDIKADNILIGHDGRARIGDFGISRMLGEDGRALECSTTDANRCDRWTPCENLQFRFEESKSFGPSMPGDVWSFGCTILELFSGKVPFHGVPNAEVTLRLNKREAPNFPSFCLRQGFERHRTGIEAFCSLCWIREPNHRPAMDVLAPILCSYCSGTDCNYTKCEKATASAIGYGPPPKRPLSGSPRTTNPRLDTESGLRSRSSSEATLVSSSSDEVPDIQVLSPETEEQPSPVSGVPFSPLSETVTEVPIPNPGVTTPAIPPPPPPTLETILRSVYKTAVSVLNESGPLGIRVQFDPGAPAGEDHDRIHTFSCKVNGVEYGKGIVRGKKKLAKELAALGALERLLNEDPLRFPTLRYLPILKDHLRSHGLGTRYQFRPNFKSGSINPSTGEYRVSFVFDGEIKVEGVGPTLPSAEETVARNVSASWSRLFGN